MDIYIFQLKKYININMFDYRLLLQIYLKILDSDPRGFRKEIVDECGPLRLIEWVPANKACRSAASQVLESTQNIWSCDTSLYFKEVVG